MMLNEWVSHIIITFHNPFFFTKSFYFGYTLLPLSTKHIIHMISRITFFNCHTCFLFKILNILHFWNIKYTYVSLKYNFQRKLFFRIRFKIFQMKWILYYYCCITYLIVFKMMQILFENKLLLCMFRGEFFTQNAE